MEEPGMRRELILAFARETVRAACEKGLTAGELKYACGWASCAPNKRIEALPVLPEDAEAIDRE